MRPIAKSAKRQVRSIESSHIVNTIIKPSHNAVSCGPTEIQIYKMLLPFGKKQVFSLFLNNKPLLFEKLVWTDLVCLFEKKQFDDEEYGEMFPYQHL